MGCQGIRHGPETAGLDPRRQGSAALPRPVTALDQEAKPIRFTTKIPDGYRTHPFYDGNEPESDIRGSQRISVWYPRSGRARRKTTSTSYRNFSIYEGN
jgi:hypothetical protein